MSVSCQVLMSQVEKIAPKYLAEEWDNVGLLIGNPAQEVSSVLVTLDCTREVVEEAVKLKADMIIAHHPLIFSPLKQLRFDLAGQGLIAKLIQENINLYAAHTNLDSSSLSGAAMMADQLRLANQEFLSAGYNEQILKLSVFVPEEFATQVREAMTKAGAGGIGNYEECFFQAPGIGTFRPLEGSNPFIGKTGTLEQVKEVKLETIVPARILDRVVRAMLKAHPYEVPAYDIIPTQNPGPSYGIGKVGYLPRENTVSELIKNIKNMLGGCDLRVAGDLSKGVKKVAICNGSGGSLVRRAIAKGADVYIAGDISHHEALDALEAGMVIVDPGHHATEWLMVEKLYNYLQESMQKEKRNVKVNLSNIKTEPFKFC